MFRKNFHADKEGGFGKVGGRSSRNKGLSKRNRDVGYSGSGDERHYRTHLFLTPPGACQGCVSCDEEAASSPLQTSPTTAFAASPPPPRRPSVTLLKWSGGGGGAGGAGGAKRKSSGALGGRFDVPASPDERLPTPTLRHSASTGAAAAGASAPAMTLSTPTRQVSYCSLLHLSLLLQ